MGGDYLGYVIAHYYKARHMLVNEFVMSVFI
jgi:hypothetical protein